ncbi:hypothetical protein [Pseudomonas phage vB_PaeM_RP7]|uniref:Uncharacterized protein n=1 Tax=Pseudomonas phage PAP-JP TaxID=2583508 RepID=A0A5C1K5G4_9CAUD|nr:hypothetical protein PAPJP_123 [Pseudomonas phage PAP-JP]UKH48017.1 MAG: hypothetical protein [Pseudomonas phage RP4]WAB56708.1 hypothetical protein [Pseudomonas phage vB_PaeM_RP15]WAB56994.1 hypothetical protein [Pseudomonas phage vB_PaeM_RP6]WAB57097.1 hypothetical protein [Pseudomonas phage vB_PaeM_RP7]WAB57234.1 hypothetical protein [Pseudomonas phage vB_PaeM_RP8]WAB57504.1 hypothetical protein [Pseudomonas phage vB_PaeM_RP9]WAB57621.1 hypothetical protein [Pseudomonas phage vB_PaeM_R
MSERLRRLEAEYSRIEREWGGLARYELEMLRIEIESERSTNSINSYRSIFGCGNAFHGRKYD